MIDMKLFGFKLNSIRNNKNISIEELEFRSGVSSSTIKAIERGQSNPTIKIVSNLSKALSVNLFEFLYRTDEDSFSSCNSLVELIEYKLSTSKFDIRDELEELKKCKNDIINRLERENLDRLSLIYSGIVDLEIYEDINTAKDKFKDSINVSKPKFYVNDLRVGNLDPLKFKAISNLSFIYKNSDFPLYLYMSEFLIENDIKKDVNYYKYLLNLSSAYIRNNQYKKAHIYINEYFRQSKVRALNLEVLFLYNKFLIDIEINKSDTQKTLSLCLSICNLLNDDSLANVIIHKIKKFELN